MAQQDIAPTDNGADSLVKIEANFTELYTGANIHSADSKTTPADADEIGLIDSAASYVIKRLSFLNLKLAIGSWLNPVGTIREFNVSTNPATLLGFGTWSAYGTGRVTVAIDAGQTEFDTNGETGGEKTHTLTSTEMPVHTHQEIVYNGGIGAGGRYIGADPEGLNITGDSGVATGNAGGGGAHNNLQPYIVVYRWVRTA